MTKKKNDIEELVEASLNLVDDECGTCIAPGQLVSDVSKDVNVLEFPKAKSIVVSEDIHGDFTQLVFKCCVPLRKEPSNTPLVLWAFSPKLAL